MKLLSNHLLHECSTHVDESTLAAAFATLPHTSDPEFGFLMEASAVYSSNIEGNTLDLNSFLKTQEFKTGSKPKEAAEIADLVVAYNTAKTLPLTEKNLLEMHAVFAERIVSAGNRGVYRQDKIGVLSARGLEYMAVEWQQVPELMGQLFGDIRELIDKNAEGKISIAEVLYYAAYAHLVFAHIHPFVDGNGRAARLLLGDRAWAMQSEKYYKEHRPEYYRHISLGIDYASLDYGKALPFLILLPKAL
jgi:Fic family protein